MRSSNTPELGRKTLWGVFAAALIGHFLLATWNWHSGFLLGNEFRQTLTAVPAQYIDWENNFSLLYPTPILGKPWAFLREFPLYQWCVVGLSRWLGLPHFEAARGVSLACFYLMLPAVWLLLGELGLSRLRRLPTLALILTCPVYIFYSRAFLIESMALMFSVWFVAAFALTMHRRQWRWLAVAAVCGALAGLVKSITLAVWVAPAALYGAWLLWRELSRRTGWRRSAAVLGWGLGTAIVPAIATVGWIRFTDTVNATHPSAIVFTTKSLTSGIFSTTNGAQFSIETWRLLLGCWKAAILPPWLIGALVLLGVLARKQLAGRILAAAGCFLLAQLLFPTAYAVQDYYFYACTVFLMVSLGFALHGLLDCRWPRGLRWGLFAVPFIAQLGTYEGNFAKLQAVRSQGGSGMADALRTFTPMDGVLVIAGADWGPIIPYYAQRRALMIRNGLENDDAYLDRAFGDLRGEPVSALILVGDQRGNQSLVRRAAAAFGTETAITFAHTTADVHLISVLHGATLSALNAQNHFSEVSPATQPTGTAKPDLAPLAVPPQIAESMCPMVSPSPSKYLFRYGFATWTFGDRVVLNVHPDSDLWVPAPVGLRRVRLRFGMHEASYSREGDRTNGVEFIVSRETQAGARHAHFRSVLDPVAEPRDRGTQSAEFTCELGAGDTLVFSTRTNGSESYDWSYWERIEVQ